MTDGSRRATAGYGDGASRIMISFSEAQMSAEGDVFGCCKGTLNTFLPLMAILKDRSKNGPPGIAIRPQESPTMVTTRRFGAFVVSGGCECVWP
jgi:hypothetical protein